MKETNVAKNSFMQLYKMLLKFNFAYDDYNSCSAMNSSMQRIVVCLA